MWCSDGATLFCLLRTSTSCSPGIDSDVAPRVHWRARCSTLEIRVARIQAVEGQSGRIAAREGAGRVLASMTVGLSGAGVSRAPNFCATTSWQPRVRGAPLPIARTAKIGRPYLPKKRPHVPLPPCELRVSTMPIAMNARGTRLRGHDRGSWRRARGCERAGRTAHHSEHVVDRGRRRVGRKDDSIWELTRSNG